MRYISGCLFHNLGVMLSLFETHVETIAQDPTMKV